MPLCSSFSFSLNNRACQQLAKLLLLWRREDEVEVEVTEWGFRLGAQPFTVRITPFRMSKWVLALFVSFIFPWFQYLLTNRNNVLTIRNMPPLAFGIHNEQYDCDMVIIWGL